MPAAGEMCLSGTFQWPPPGGRGGHGNGRKAASANRPEFGIKRLAQNSSEIFFQDKEKPTWAWKQTELAKDLDSTAQD